MRAIRFHAFGGPEVLSVDEVPTPKAGRGEVLVRVEAAWVNPVDYKIRNGGFVPADQLPMAAGREVAGVVAQCGAGTTGFSIGDRVYAMLPIGNGGFAEFAAIRAADCATAPGRIGLIDAAAVPLAGLTAWQALFDHGGLAEGQHILIHGAAGGVGHFAVQFAKARGARIMATCSAQDIDFVRSVGADQVIDYRSERFEDVAHDLDLVLDLVGGETQDRSFGTLKAGGVLVSTPAKPSQEKAAARRVRAMMLEVQADGGQLADIARLIDKGEVTPVIDAVFPLAQAAAAERRLEQEHVRGKLVLKIA